MQNLNKTERNSGTGFVMKNLSVLWLLHEKPGLFMKKPASGAKSPNASKQLHPHPFKRNLCVYTMVDDYSEVCLNSISL